MALKFRTVQREVLLGDDAGKIKTYAVAKANGYCDIDKLCELVSARSTVSSADVKAVIDSMNWVMHIELRSGNIVQLGEFGNFRLSVKSNGTETEKEFNATNIKKARIIFTPGTSLRSTQSNVSFEHDKPIEKESDKSNPE
ncbi:DNA-binding protein [Bacteroidia bacterium]|nr:DNA-binding protein [Bacteroidia bacterium]